MTAPWAGPFALVAYYSSSVGRSLTHHAMMEAMQEHARPASERRPFWQSVGIGATHCGAGCALADLIIEWSVLALPIVVLGSRVLAAGLPTS